MEEKKKIDNFEEFVKEEVLREVAQIDETVAAYKEQHSYEYPKELDQKIMDQIRRIGEKQKAYEMLSEEDKEALRLGREAMIRRELEEDEETYPEEKRENANVVPFKKRSKKAWGLVALVAALTMVFGMTGIGGRPFLLEMIGVDVGEKDLTRVESENVKENEEQLGAEAAFEQEIKETFNTTFVRMIYLPEKTDFLMGDINKEQGQIYILYQYEKQIIEYQMILNYREKSYGYDVEDELISEETIKVSNVPITVSCYKLPDGQEQYVAQFKYRNTYYILNGIIPRAELENILKNLNFF